MSDAASLVCIDAELHLRLPAPLLPEGMVVLLDPQQNGIEQITALLNQRQLHRLHRLHLIGYGSANSLQLGTTHLNLFTLDRYGWQLQQWGEALTADAEIFLYGFLPLSTPLAESLPQPRAQTLPTLTAQSHGLQRLRLLTGANLAAFKLEANGVWTIEAMVGTMSLACPLKRLPQRLASSL